MLPRGESTGVKTRRCCHASTQDKDQQPAWPWQRGGLIVGWMLPSATLVLLPKCPVCVAMYVALWSGVGISVESAAHLRTGLLVLCVAALLGMALKHRHEGPNS